MTPGLLATLQARFTEGRDIEDRDADRSPWVAVVNETLARHLWPGQDAVGRNLRLQSLGEDHPRKIIGEIRDIPTRSRDRNPQPVLYTSYLQQPAHFPELWAANLARMTFVVRTARDPLRLAPAVRSAVAEIDPVHPVSQVTSLERYLRGRLPDLGFYVMLLLLLAAVAVLLAAIGVYGIASYAMAQRTREIGVRIALGAAPRHIWFLVARWAVILGVAGIGIGLAAALALTRSLRPQLWGVEPTDPATYLIVAGVLLLVVLLAALLPARRAIAVDPVAALRSD